MYKTFKSSAEKTCSTTRAWVDLAISGIALAMDVIDVLESLASATIIDNFFDDKSFDERNKDNNYISAHDIYLMVTSGVRTAAMIANSLLLMYDNLTADKTASIELNSFGACVTGSDISIDFKTMNQKAGPVNSKATHDKVDTEATDVIQNTDNPIEDIQTIDISNTGSDTADIPYDDMQAFVFMVSLATKALVKMIAENTAQKVIESASTTNLLLKDTEGDKDIKVSNEEAKLNEQKTTANENDAKINQDDVKLSQGNLSGSEVGGTAMVSDSTALQDDNSAVGTKLGTMETDVNVLKSD